MADRYRLESTLNDDGSVTIDMTKHFGGDWVKHEDLVDAEARESKLEGKVSDLEAQLDDANAEIEEQKSLVRQHEDTINALQRAQ